MIELIKDLVLDLKTGYGLYDSNQYTVIMSWILIIVSVIAEISSIVIGTLIMISHKNQPKDEQIGYLVGGFVVAALAAPAVMFVASICFILTYYLALVLGLMILFIWIIYEFGGDVKYFIIGIINIIKPKVKDCKYYKVRFLKL